MRQEGVPAVLLHALGPDSPSLQEHAVSAVVLFTQSAANHAAFVDNGLLPALVPLLRNDASVHCQTYALCALLHIAAGRGRSHAALIERAGAHDTKRTVSPFEL